MANDWVYSSGKVQLNNRIMNLAAQPIEFNNMAADPAAAVGSWWIFAESDVLWAMDELGAKTPLTGSGAYDPHKIYWGTSNVEILAEDGQVDVDVAGTNRMRITTAGGLVMNLANSNLNLSSSGLDLRTDADDGDSVIRVDDTTSFTGRLYVGARGSLKFQTGNLFPVRLNIDTDGKLSTGAEDYPDVTAGGLCLNQNANLGKILTFKGTGNVLHPFTDVAEADTFGVIQPYSGLGNGGLQITGLGDTTVVPGITMLSLTVAPNTGYSSGGVFYLGAYKSDGGTSFTSLASNETALSLSTVGGGPKFSVLGNGDSMFGGLVTLGGETGPDCSSGGVCSNIQSNGYTWLTLKGAIGATENFTAHPFTTQTESDTFFRISGPTDKSGGAYIEGFGQGNGIQITGFKKSGSTSTGPIIIRGAKSNGGTSYTALASTEVVMNIYNSSTNALRFYGNGDIYKTGWISNGELAPDCSSSGLCMNDNDSTFNITCKGSNVNHLVTGWLETDTAWGISKYSSASGGINIRAVTEGTYSTRIQGCSTTENATSSTAGLGNITLQASLKSGNTSTTHATTTNMMVLRNDTSTRFIWKGDGDFLYYNTGTIGTFDTENDVQLIRDLQLAISPDAHKLSESQVRKLEEIGVMENGFMSSHKKDALELGAIGQLFNMIRGLASELGITSEQLFKYAKEYSDAY